MQWDHQDDATLSPGVSKLGELSDDNFLMDEISFSSDSTSSQSDNMPRDPQEPPSPPAFADFGMEVNDILIQDDEEAKLYQNKQVYDSKEDNDWWNEWSQ